MNHLDFFRNEILKIKPELQSRYKIGSIGLFGSIVRNDFVADRSDIDIIVDFTAPVGVEFIDLADFLESKLQRKIDLVSKRGVKPEYLRQIESEVVYV